MYISLKQCDVLYKVCSRFEVALRSYVSSNVVSHFTKTTFIENMNLIASSIDSLPEYVPINMQKYKAKAKSLANETTYDLLKNANESFKAKDVIDGDIHSLGKLVDIIILLYNPLFVNLSNKFDSHDQFINLLSNYHDVRNSLSHIASAKIINQNAERVTSLVSGTILSMQEKFFWFSPKLDIKNQISEYIKISSSDVHIKNNLNVISKKHKELVLREKEMKELSLLICGDGSYGRVAGSVELHGYGGVGKTSLALEFCHEIIRNELNDLGKGYSFVLWMSSKNEELTYNNATGTLLINQLNPLFSYSEDIVNQLTVLLGYEEMDQEQLLYKLDHERKKGIIVLDNLETIELEEKQKIKELIRKFPRDIQFILTSRNYESIAEAQFQVLGYSDLALGNEFISKLLISKKIDVNFSEKQIEKLIINSFGNTLIIVLGIERMLNGKVSFDQLINELQVYKESDIEIIVDFMYKNTFDNVLKEIEKEASDIDCKLLLTVMLLYNEPVDFHSLRELIKVEDSKKLDYVLEKLTTKFVLNLSEGYYELQEFAAKFVILKLLPDDLKIAEVKKRIVEYKKRIKMNLKNLYDDRQNYSKIEPILEDWKPNTEADTVAIAQSYTMFKEVNAKLRILKKTVEFNKFLKDVKEEFKLIEKRSYHPYIKFQKARILKLFLLSNHLKGKEYLTLSHDILIAYEETYFSINLKNKFLLSMESYAAFLWIYGMHLSDLKKDEDAARILEESIERFSSLDNIRNELSYLKAYCLLSRNYIFLYMRTKNLGYLQGLKDAYKESLNLNKMRNHEISLELNLFNLFIEAVESKKRNLKIITKINKLKPIPPYLRGIEDATRNLVLAK